MDNKTLARIGAIVFVTFAVVATAIDLSRPDDRQDEFAMPGSAVVGRDPLDTELARCGSLGEAGPRDPSCPKAWAESRRRFLGQPAAIAPAAPTSVPAPSSAPIEAPASISAPTMNGAR